jgi:uncharacterized Fe-S center protein
MFASFDPVALDVACADAVNQQPAMTNSVLADKLSETLGSQDALGAHDHTKPHEDYFKVIGPHTNWRTIIDHAVKIGLGSDRYTIKEV